MAMSRNQRSIEVEQPPQPPNEGIGGGETERQEQWLADEAEEVESGPAWGVYPDMDPDVAAQADGLCEDADVQSSLAAEFGGEREAGFPVLPPPPKWCTCGCSTSSKLTCSSPPPTTTQPPDLYPTTSARRPPPPAP